MNTLKASPACLALIRSCEGLRLDAYQCPAGRWTIGYGHTGDVQPGDKITHHQAEILLEHDVKPFELHINALCLTLSQGEFDALVSFAYNLGLGTLRRSTLVKKLADGDRHGAADEFLRWTFSRGERLPGLETRRMAERRMFLGE